MDNKQIAKEIRKCFSTEIRNQIFIVNGQRIRVDGEEKFYKKSEIDKIIGKLDKLVKKLEK